MSRMASSDDIDELVSSVRDFISHKEPPRTRSRILLDRLILTPEQRVHEDEVANESINKAFSYVAPRPAAPALPPVKRFDKSGLEATIAELEAAVTAQFDDWEADEGESFGKDAWAESAFPSEPNDSGKLDIERIVSAELGILDDADTPQLPPAAPNSNGLAGGEEATVSHTAMPGFDEAALRRLVIEIVHVELGGELGERITRNVRKMVRREINRALTGRELGAE